MEGEMQKIKVKVRINIHGLFNVSSASLYERKDTGDEDQEMVNAAENGVENGQVAQNQEATTPNSTSEVSPTSWSKRISKWFSSVRIFLNCLACRSLKVACSKKVISTKRTKEK